MKFLREYEHFNSDDEEDYENNLGEPEVGDFVICTNMITIDKNNQEVENFISSHIGKLIEIQDGTKYHVVSYSNIPNSIIDDFLFATATKFLISSGKLSEIDSAGLFKRPSILYWSKDPKKLEYLIQANKYNL